MAIRPVARPEYAHRLIFKILKIPQRFVWLFRSLLSFKYHGKLDVEHGVKKRERHSGIHKRTISRKEKKVTHWSSCFLSISATCCTILAWSWHPCRLFVLDEEGIEAIVQGTAFTLISTTAPGGALGKAYWEQGVKMFSREFPCPVFLFQVGKYCCERNLRQTLPSVLVLIRLFAAATSSSPFANVGIPARSSSNHKLSLFGF